MLTGAWLLSKKSHRVELTSNRKISVDMSGILPAASVTPRTLSQCLFPLCASVSPWQDKTRQCLTTPCL